MVTKAETLTLQLFTHFTFQAKTGDGLYCYFCMYCTLWFDSQRLILVCTSVTPNSSTLTQWIFVVFHGIFFDKVGHIASELGLVVPRTRQWPCPPPHSVL